MASITSPPWFSVTDAAKALLTAAAHTWEDPDVAEQYVQQALAQPDVALDVLVSVYRYYFYRNNNVRALEMAVAVCDRIQTVERWPTQWETLKPLLSDQLDTKAVRLYLSAYAASGLLLARLGSREAAQKIAAQVQQIEAKEFGGELLFNILNAPPDEDDE